MSKFKFQKSKKTDTSIIEITDDDDSCSPKKTNYDATINNTLQSSGYGSIAPSGAVKRDVDGDILKIESDVCLTSGDVEDLDMFLNAKPEYVTAMEELQKNLDQIGSCKTPKPLAKWTDSQPLKSSGKFKFQKPKSANDSTPTSTASSTKTIPDMFRKVLDSNKMSSSSSVTSSAASSASVSSSTKFALPLKFDTSSQDSAKENCAIIDDDEWDNLVNGLV